ncbi:hypothetical protein PTTG_26722 [Puccinia triticina 1-1 BBBD Race 1]|uniref:CCHC-type domain-containing protein n=1 Tax=Puccinia triticina (isolate 1-1 / race 1 (BBBD)) TaxID=630390 RepID=A0A180GRL2_PUCT1|nr:hypothetical protein PTTG_26722 [Puccinia triticina 1-1 BBBD Race 1]
MFKLAKRFPLIWILRRKELQGFEEAEFLLRQSKLVAGSIQSAKSLFRLENVLRPDGKNFGDWYRNLSEVGRACLTSGHFFFEKCNNTTFEKIGRAVLIGSIDRSLVAEMQKFTTCYEMFEALFVKFKTASRAAQMNIWYKFRNFKINPDGHNAGISSGLKDLLSEWVLVGVNFGTDALLGFIVQAAVMESEAQYRLAFERCVEDLVQSDKKGSCPTFESVMNALDICKEQHRNIREMETSGPAFASSQAPLALLTTAITEDTFDVLAFLSEINQSEWVNALDFYALTALTCWQCGGSGHYARNCPNKPKGQSSNHQYGQPIGTLVGTIYGQLPSGLLVHSGRFPRMNGRKPMTPPTRNQEHVRSLADYYRPRYSTSNQQIKSQPVKTESMQPVQEKGGVSAHIVEVNDLPDDLDQLDFHSMALGEDLRLTGMSLSYNKFFTGAIVPSVGFCVEAGNTDKGGVKAFAFTQDVWPCQPTAYLADSQTSNGFWTADRDSCGKDPLPGVRNQQEHTTKSVGINSEESGAPRCYGSRLDGSFSG